MSRRDARSKRLLLDRVNLTINAGDRIGLSGPSGSGKSSLMRAIAKLDRFQSGEMIFQSRAIRLDDVPAYRRQVIYMPQQPSFLTGTVRENLQVAFGLAASIGCARPDPQTTIDRLAVFGRTASMLDQAVDKLSGGEQQIVAIVRALALSPTVLLLDEPTSGLDAEAAERFEELVLAWQRETAEHAGVARAFVWTSHDAAQVRRMTARTITMRDGVLLTEDRDV